MIDTVFRRKQVLKRVTRKYGLTKQRCCLFLVMEEYRPGEKVRS